MSGANGATGYCQQKGGGRFVAFAVPESGSEKMATKEFLSATKPLARSRALFLVARIFCVCCTPGGRKASSALFLASSRKGEV
jgi:putative hemolysin